MNSAGLLSSLSLFTLLAGVAILAIVLVLFMRKRSNRKPLPDDEGFEDNRDTPLRR